MMAKLTTPFTSKTALLMVGALATSNTALNASIECPPSMPVDLSPCTFDSRFDPELSCVYKSEDCFPSGGCAQIRCQCLLSAFACVVDPLPCQELCPATKPNTSQPCDLGVAIDCVYGDPIFCPSEQPFFCPVESVCYCFNNSFSCNEFACQSAAPSTAPLEITTCPQDDPWKNVAASCSLDEGEKCDYDEFCCPNGTCVPHTTCRCVDGSFTCEQPPLPCPSACPGIEPTSDEACQLHPRFLCEYSVGKCDDAFETKAARECICNFLDQRFACFDACNSTFIDNSRFPTSAPYPFSFAPSNTNVIHSSGPSEPTSLASSIPSHLTRNTSSNIPSFAPSHFPSDKPSDAPSDRPTEPVSLAPSNIEVQSPESPMDPSSTMPTSRPPTKLRTTAPSGACALTYCLAISAFMIGCLFL